MLNRIFVIAENSWMDLVSRKAIYILVLVWIFGFWGPLLLQLILLRPPGVTESSVAEYIVFFARGLVFLGLMVSIYYSTQIVESEMSNRTLANILVRPIERWEYLLGRLLGVIMFFFLFVLSALVFSYVASFVFQGHLDFHFPLGILQRFFGGLCVIAIAYSMGTVLPSVLTLALLIIFKGVSAILSLIPDDLSRSIAIIKSVVHFSTPANWTVDYLAKSSDLGQSLSLNVAILLENVAYGIGAFLVAAWLFASSDIKVKVD